MPAKEDPALKDLLETHERLENARRIPAEILNALDEWERVAAFVPDVDEDSHRFGFAADTNTAI